MSHSRFSASGATRWMNCLGSVELEAKCKPTTSKYAAEGSAAHEFVENHLFNTQFSEPDGEELTNALITYRDHIFSVLMSTRDCTIQIEKRITLEFIDAELYGTADCVIHDHTNKHLHVVDFKYGKTKVDPSCDQLKYYSVGSCYGKDVDRIYLTIVQPRLRNKTIDKVRTYETNKEELTVFAKKLKQTVMEIKNGNTTLELGQYCFFCSAKQICPKYKQKAVRSAIDDFKGV